MTHRGAHTPRGKEPFVSRRPVCVCCVCVRVCACVLALCRRLDGDTVSSCSPAQIRILPGTGAEIRLAWQARGAEEDDHVEVYVGRSALSGVANCMRWTGNGCTSLLEDGRPGRCAEQHIVPEHVAHWLSARPAPRKAAYVI